MTTAQILMTRAWRRATVGGEWSLRQRLMLLVSVGTVAAWLVGGIVVMLTAQSENERLHISRLEDFGRVVLRFAEHEIDEILADRPGDIIHVETGVTLDPRFRYQVRSESGELVLVSVDTTREPFVPLNSVGHQEVEIDGVEHYVYSLWNDRRSLQIQVMERPDHDDFIFGSAGIRLAMFFVITVIALLAINRWMIGRATRALDQAAAQMVNRSPGDLQPIVTDNPPRELVPLLKATNALFGRIGHAFTVERNFTANAAHELRTPLAAVRIQAQVAERARSEVGAHEALQQLGTCVERASRMIDQLLTLARVESVPIAPASMIPVQLDQVARQALVDLRPVLGERKIELDARTESVTVRGLEFGLSSLVRNLVENAARYTPAAGTVRVASWQDAHGVYLAVDDSGPGIAHEERERVFEPFYRLPTTEGVEGCGIGLSIVRSVVRVHGGEISLSDSTLGGLRVVVRFPYFDASSKRAA